VTSGPATTDVVVVQATFHGCIAGSPVPTAGHYVAKGEVALSGANDCANWFAAPSGSKVMTFANAARFYGSVQWAPSSISASIVRFANMRIATGAGGRLTMKLPNAGAGTVTGSYVPTANVTLKIAQTYSAVSAACGGPGVPSLTIIPSIGTAHSTGTW
jgi:hypothetical protein